MRTHIVADSEFGGALIRRMLRDIPNVAITGAEELGSAISTVRSIWSHRLGPVAAVVESRSTYPATIDETEVAAGDMGGPFFDPGAVLIMAVPEVAAALFESPEHLARTLGVDIDHDERIRAEYVPGPVLDSLIARSPCVHSRDEFIAAIDDVFAEHIRRHVIFQRIEHFARTALPSEPVRAAAA